MIFLFIPQTVGSKWYIVIYTINAIPVRIYCWRCIKISLLIGEKISIDDNIVSINDYIQIFRFQRNCFAKWKWERCVRFFSASCDSLLSFRFSKVCMPGSIFLKTHYRGEKSAGKITQVHSSLVDMIKDVFPYVHIRWDVPLETG